MHRALIAIAFVMLLPAAAFAAPTNSCGFNTAPLLIFPTYNVFSPFGATSTGEIIFTCHGPAEQTVSVSLSHGTSNTNEVRELHQREGGTNILYYNVFSDPGYTRIWGDGTAGSSPVIAVARNGIPVSLPFFGAIPAMQDVSPGHYGDALVVTLNF